MNIGEAKILELLTEMTKNMKQQGEVLKLHDLELQRLTAEIRTHTHNKELV